jgi:hypothetical protein
MIHELITRHVVASRPGRRFAKDFSEDDCMVIDRWLAKERSAANPDFDSWESMLLGDKPFFVALLENILKDRWVETILHTARPLNVLNEYEVKEEFPVLGDQGIRFLLHGIDSKRRAIFGAKQPLLVDMASRQSVWRMESEDSSSIRIVQAELADVIAVPLREWKKGGMLLKSARERLCDLFSTCFAKSR